MYSTEQVPDFKTAYEIAALPEPEYQSYLRSVSGYFAGVGKKIDDNQDSIAQGEGSTPPTVSDDKYHALYVSMLQDREDSVAFVLSSMRLLHEVQTAIGIRETGPGPTASRFDTAGDLIGVGHNIYYYLQARQKQQQQ